MLLKDLTMVLGEICIPQCWTNLERRNYRNSDKAGWFWYGTVAALFLGTPKACSGRCSANEPRAASAVSWNV